MPGDPLWHPGMSLGASAMGEARQAQRGWAGAGHRSPRRHRWRARGCPWQCHAGDKPMLWELPGEPGDNWAV